MPVTCESDPVIGVDSSISRPLPAGGPSRISVSTTSASSISTIRCAVVDPTNPPPTTVTFFRICPFSYSTQFRFTCEILLLVQESATNSPRASFEEQISDESRFSPAPTPYDLTKGHPPAINA